MSTLMATRFTLSKNVGQPLAYPTPYKSTVGALQYATLTPLKFAFCVNKLGQITIASTHVHWQAINELYSSP
ncbi:unnamed protein product [Dovyalis caffra]|uniref:Uncharacterized protein n=1 Tax=Dovyalis caffra TaxID=77055 RepID=A0AAV1RFW0_9ROSI|nr:unnamed protein product [Dovyalis caffra]